MFDVLVVGSLAGLIFLAGKSLETGITCILSSSSYTLYDVVLVAKGIVVDLEWVTKYLGSSTIVEQVQMTIMLVPTACELFGTFFDEWNLIELECLGYWWSVGWFADL